MKKKISLDKLTLKKAENKTALILYNADGSSEIAMNLLSNDELQRWIEAFSYCKNLTVTDYCCDLISSLGPQKIDMSNMHNMVESTLQSLVQKKISTKFMFRYSLK
ncbi:hypothetical protein LOAG_18324 [Loa loa]|uniref:PH domain-containing protein n=1 Tax=Loa loa TaxID=7209 RepID=A0A1S0UFY3_LOALO|nr:hypothetical protein LOAG_18324 [Loa loa]EJD74351.1 hypothetical protein LOAG_18324 [Loa loa]